MVQRETSDYQETRRLTFRLTVEVIRSNTKYYEIVPGGFVSDKRRRIPNIKSHGNHCAEMTNSAELARSLGCDRQMQRHCLSQQNLKLAYSTWGPLPSAIRNTLRKLTESHGLSVASGDLQLLNNRWYVTHAGLLGIARRHRCAGMRTDLLRHFSDPALDRWVFKATIYKSTNSRGFVGYGDADPSNCSSLVHGAELRIAETRAVNRALRKAYGIGLCSVEELGAISRSAKSSPSPPPPTSSNGPHSSNGSANGQPRLRDQLCLLIRQYSLDASLVRAYAADFCGTEKLSGASHELVESFISHLSACAKENRDALVRRLNSYSHSQDTEARS